MFFAFEVYAYQMIQPRMSFTDQTPCNFPAQGSFLPDFSTGCLDLGHMDVLEHE